MLESLFNKVRDLKACKFVKKRLHLLSTPILKNICEQVLLQLGFGNNLNMGDFKYETLPFIDFIQKWLMQ